MTEKSYELTLDELKALYADGKFTGSDLLVKNNLGYTVLHYLTKNKNVLSIFQWLADLKWITKDDLFIKNAYRDTVLHYFEDEDQEKILSLFDDKEKTQMTKELHLLNLEELKALYANGNLTKSDLLREKRFGYEKATELHYLGRYNKDVFSIFQWLADLKWITKDDLFIKNKEINILLYYIMMNYNALNTLEWLIELKWITKEDLFATSNGDTLIIQWFAFHNKNALNILKRLKEINFITKDDLFITDRHGNTLVTYFANNSRNEGKAVLALFDDEKTACKAETKPITKDNNIIKGNFVQKTTDKSFFDLEIDFLLKNLNIVDSDLEGDSQVYLSAQDIKETEKVTLEFHRINETIISLKILRNLKNEEKLFEQNYEIDKNTFKKIIKINI